MLPFFPQNDIRRYILHYEGQSCNPLNRMFGKCGRKGGGADPRPGTSIGGQMVMAYPPHRYQDFIGPAMMSLGSCQMIPLISSKLRILGQVISEFQSQPRPSSGNPQVLRHPQMCHPGAMRQPQRYYYRKPRPASYQPRMYDQRLPRPPQDLTYTRQQLRYPQQSPRLLNNNNFFDVLKKKLQPWG